MIIAKNREKWLLTQKYVEFLSMSKTRIEQYEKELEKMRNIIPFD